MLSLYTNKAKKYQYVFNQHVIDPVRRGKRYMHYMNSVMLGTFDNVRIKDSGEIKRWPFRLIGQGYGLFSKNLVTDFKLGSELKGPGVNHDQYHHFPVLVEGLGAETKEVRSKNIKYP